MAKVGIEAGTLGTNTPLRAIARVAHSSGKRVFAEERQSRLISIQALRVVAAMGVVGAHLSFSYQSLYDKRSAIWDFFDGNFGVDLFFVISGFIMIYTSKDLYKTYRPSLTFITHRFIRIVPLYWIATSIMLVQMWHNGALSSVSWKVILGSYAFLPFPSHQGGPLLIVGWTLNIEVFFYAVFSLSVRYRPILAALVVTSLLLPLSLLGQAFYADRSSFIAGFTNPMMLEFLMGIWLGVLYIYGVRLHLLLACGVMVCAALLIHSADRSGAQNITRALDWGAACSCVIAATTFVKLDGGLRRWSLVVLVGDATYAIYLLHWFFIMNPPSFLTHMFPPLVHPALYSVSVVTLVVGAGILTNLAVERPLVRKLRGYLSPTPDPRLRRQKPWPQSQHPEQVIWADTPGEEGVRQQR